MQSHISISAGKYSSCISLFLRAQDAGKVHSIFRQGMNVQFADELVFIGHDQNGIVPFGIHLDAVEVERILARTFIDEELVWNREARQLSFMSSKIRVELSKMFPIPCELIAPSQSVYFMPDAVRLMQGLVADHVKVLGFDLSAQYAIQLLDQVNQSCSFSTELENRFMQLKACIASESEELDMGTVRYFIGRGRGLTPSGDDFLVGMMAIERLLKREKRKVSHVMELVRHDLPRLTTPVSVNYYNYAIRGCFSTPILEVISALQAQDRERLAGNILKLLQTGHSSGTDTLYGMIFALKMYLKIL